MSSTDPVQRNPLHPQALTLDDIVPGRHVIRFNVMLGILGEYEVLEAPRYEYVTLLREHCHRVMLRDIKTGEDYDYFLNDLGVTPYPVMGWNDTNFIIDASDRDTLPERNTVMAERDATARVRASDGWWNASPQ